MRMKPLMMRHVKKTINTHPFAVVALIDDLNVVLSRIFWTFQKLSEALVVCYNFEPTAEKQAKIQ